MVHHEDCMFAIMRIQMTNRMALFDFFGVCFVIIPEKYEFKLLLIWIDITKLCHFLYLSFTFTLQIMYHL